MQARASFCRQCGERAKKATAQFCFACGASLSPSRRGQLGAAAATVGSDSLVSALVEDPTVADDGPRALRDKGLEWLSSRCAPLDGWLVGDTSNWIEVVPILSALTGSAYVAYRARIAYAGGVEESVVESAVHAAREEQVVERRRKRLWRTFVGLGLGCCGLLLVIIGVLVGERLREPDTPKVVSSGTVTPSASALPVRLVSGASGASESAQRVRMNERFEVEDLAYRIYRAWYANSLGDPSVLQAKAAFGQTFLVVEFVVENLGDVAVAADLNSLLLVDSNGRSYQVSSHPYLSIAMGAPILRPGEWLHLTWAFEVPRPVQQESWILRVSERSHIHVVGDSLNELSVVEVPLRVRQ